jgi:GNAT superfamily N-acetyltransferase
VFLGLYRNAFDPLAPLSPARQALSEEEFLAAMEDESVIKFVGWDRDEQPHAMAIVATDLRTVPWISVPYFEARFPDHHRRGAIFYFHALLVRSESQGGPWARLLLEELIRIAARYRAVAAFDSCTHTVEVARLPEMIVRLAKRLCILDPIELDRQHYYAYVYEPIT